MRETTFFSQLCLIQAATDEAEVIIDPLADDLDLKPFLDILTNPKIVKVMHSARQDMEIFYELSKQVPAPLFDTQIAAMALGYGDSVGYMALVKGRLGLNLDKGARFTDWSRRPLSNKQLHYALGDVTHLRDLYPGMLAELKDKGRLKWVEEEMLPMLKEDLYTFDPESAPADVFSKMMRSMTLRRTNHRI
jgi:ribonuclease D